MNVVYLLNDQGMVSLSGIFIWEVVDFEEFDPILYPRLGAE